MKRYRLFYISILITLQSMAQKPDFIVAQDGSGNFTSIQAAINACKAFPDSTIRIFIKNGTYYEKILIPACNPKLHIVGESKENTIISFDDYFDKINKGRNSTFFTYTMLIEADDFRMEHVTVQNTAGAVGQAVAIHSEGDRCVFVNCIFRGNQDTMYLSGEKSRVYMDNCFIEGTTDFIFGGATAYFENCILHSKSNSYITAASTIKDKKFGFVFFNCSLTAAENVNNVYLGRPWRDYAKVVFINCRLGKHIAEVGWSNWDKTTRDKTAYFAEFKNSGEGSDVNKRVKWSHQLTKQQAKAYSKPKVLSGYESGKKDWW